MIDDESGIRDMLRTALERAGYSVSVADGAGWGPDESVELAKIVGTKGVDVIDCSSGGMSGAPLFMEDEAGAVAVVGVHTRGSTPRNKGTRLTAAMLANTARTVRLGIKSLLVHKLRSFLTVLGLLFGVSSVIRCPQAGTELPLAFSEQGGEFACRLPWEKAKGNSVPG